MARAPFTHNGINLHPSNIEVLHTVGLDTYRVTVGDSVYVPAFAEWAGGMATITTIRKPCFRIDHDGQVITFKGAIGVKAPGLIMYTSAENVACVFRRIKCHDD